MLLFAIEISAAIPAFINCGETLHKTQTKKMPPIGGIFIDFISR